jgi:YidC/Oxa1 family membrane protein insertase
LDAFTGIWNSLLVWPIEGALLYLTDFTGSAGLAIILFTIAVRTAMLPLTMTQVRSQRAMMNLQPRLKELQRRHAGDRQRIAQEQMRLYKEAGVNPVAGCLPMVLQMPIWIALYSALTTLGNEVPQFRTSFLWIQNLGASSAPSVDPATWPLLILPVLAGLTQWVVQKMSTMPTADPQQQQMNRMMEFMPIMFIVFSLQVGAGLALYWVVSNLYTIIQQRVLVGWGSLPYLGSSVPQVIEARPTAEGSVPPEPPRRRDNPRPPRRRRRGK